MKVEVLFNGTKITYVRIGDFFYDLLFLLDDLSPLDALRSNFNSIFDLLSEFGSVANSSSIESADKRSISSMLHQVKNLRDLLKKDHDREYLVKLKYDLALKLKGLGYLPGFSTWTPIEKGACWFNPERRRITNEN